MVEPAAFEAGKQVRFAPANQGHGCFVFAAQVREGFAGSAPKRVAGKDQPFCRIQFLMNVFKDALEMQIEAEVDQRTFDGEGERERIEQPIAGEALLGSTDREVVDGIAAKEKGGGGGLRIFNFFSARYVVVVGRFGQLSCSGEQLQVVCFHGVLPEKSPVWLSYLTGLKSQGAN